MKLRQITKLEITDHYYLSTDDKCYYLDEYAVGQGYKYSKFNQLIFNLKKDMSRQGRPDFRFKRKAISDVIQYFRCIFQAADSSNYCIVPIPPSKSPNDPLYDDRIYEIASNIFTPSNAIKLLNTITSRDPAHTNENSDRNPDSIEQNIMIDVSLISAVEGRTIILLDDILNTGASYLACKNIISRHFPHNNVIGLFVGRCVRP